MRYDFDTVPVIPDQLRAKRAARGYSNGLGNERVAVFRDERALNALRSADPEVREVFAAAGFALTPHESKVPYGYFRQRESGSRLTVLTALHDRLASNRDVLSRRDWGAFSLETFLDHTAAAAPLATEQPVRIQNVVSFRSQVMEQVRGDGVAIIGTKAMFWGLLGIVLTQYVRSTF